MKLLLSPIFKRRLKRLLKKNGELGESIGKTLKLLESDTFHPTLRTHKLRGKFEGSWACSVAYDLRIIFEFIELENTEAILLQTIGTHDEVY